MPYDFTALALVVLMVGGIGPNHTEGAEPVLEKHDLFNAGQEGYEVCRIPGIVVTAKGTLLAYAEARSGGRGDWGPIDIVLRRGTDQGKIWSAPLKVADVLGPHQKNPAALAQKLARPTDVTYNNPVAIADRNGAVHFLFCQEYNRCFYERSDDDGQSFTKPVEITATFELFRHEYDWKVLATGPGHAIQLANGRLLVPVWLSLGTGGHAHRPSAISTIFSDDGGRSWQRGAIVAIDGGLLANPSESAVEQLSDGRVMLNIRSESPQNRRAFAISPNGESDWNSAAFDPQLSEPICMASLCRLNDAEPTGKHRLLFANPDNLERADGKAAPGTSRDRKNLTVRVSYDDGRSWPVSKTLEAGPSAYSDLAIGSDGAIYCLYERGRRETRSAPNGLPALTLARFNLEWLTDGKDQMSPPGGAAK